MFAWVISDTMDDGWPLTESTLSYKCVIESGDSGPVLMGHSLDSSSRQ